MLTFPEDPLCPVSSKEGKVDPIQTLQTHGLGRPEGLLEWGFEN